MATTPRVDYNGYTEDETYCSRGICPHPSCWESHVRAAKGFKKYATDGPHSSQQLAHSVSDDEELPKYSMYNMLDEYGLSAKDTYPSRALQTNSTSRYTSGRRLMIPSAPVSSPMKDQSVNEMSIKESTEADISSVHMKSVEVQEVFDLKELNQSWDHTFIAKPVYIWVPNMKKRKKIKRSSARRGGSGGLIDSADLVNVKNVTDDLIQDVRVPVDPGIKPTSRPPANIPTGGQPYKNVGQTPKDRMRYRQIMEELKDLPRPFILEVLEKTKGMKNKEEILLIMEKYLKLMPKTDYEMSMVTGQVLQQRPLHSSLSNQHDKIIHPQLQHTRYKLDESPGYDLASGGETNKYKPLPDISQGGVGSRASKKRSVRLQVTGSRDGVKPFHYAKISDFHVNLEPEQRSRTISRVSAITQTEEDVVSLTEVKADMSVLYDAESVMKNNENTNNSNNLGVVPATADDPMDITPHTDNKHVEILESVAETGDNPLARELSVEERVKSAQLVTKRHIEKKINRARSLDLSIIPRYSRSRAEQLIELERTGVVPLSPNPSRLDAQSTASNWPNVDEAEILEAQTKAEQRPPSEAKIPSHPSTASKPASHKKFVVELKVITGNEEPRPPPPSPEPADRKNTVNSVESKHIETIGQTAAPPTEHSESITGRQLVVDKTEESSPANGLIAEFKAGLDITTQRREDPFSIVPDYNDIEYDRELTLSVLPPSILDSTPRQTPSKITTSEKPNLMSDVVEEPQSAVMPTAEVQLAADSKIANADPTRPITRELPGIIQAMNMEDQGGFAGQ